MPSHAFTPALFSASAAAAYLSLSESTVRTLPIPRVRHGTRVLYRKQDLDAYADALPYEAQEDNGRCDEADAAWGS